MPEVHPAATSGNIVRLCSTCLHDGVLEKALERAGAAEARLAEVRQAVTTFRSHYAGTLDDQAADVICAVLQVLDRVPLGTEERSDEKEAGRG